MTVNEQLKESPRHVSIELKDVRGRRKIMCTLFAIHKESIIVFFFFLLFQTIINHVYFFANYSLLCILKLFFISYHCIVCL